MHAGLNAVLLLLSLFIVVVGSRTDYHASADVAELGLLAVVVLELVRPVVEGLGRLGGGRLLPLLLLHLLVVDEKDLE